MAGRDPRFESSFMDDYFAEADEHLLAIRRCLLMLDGVERPDPSSAILEELFRSCHSLKGISAMVELREAEVLAHHMESCLRAIRQGQTALDAANLDLKNPNYHRKDADLPVALARTYGKGRTFWSNFGHFAETWDDPDIQQMYFEAIKWAMGVTPGDAGPSTAAHAAPAQR
jgi:chemotaxis protein histidine kinase CheA